MADAQTHTEPLATDPWADAATELPPRPRRRLLAPLPLALLGVLLLACGFIAGVLVEKGQSSPAGAGGASARLAALGASGLGRGAGARGSTASGAGGGSAAAGGAGGFAGFGGRFGRAGGAGGRGPGGTSGGAATFGEVAFIEGRTLYVSGLEGNTVKVEVPAGATITKTVASDLHGIHPGDNVVVRGASGRGGAIDASTVSVTAAGASGGGGGGGGIAAALFGR